MKKRTIIILVVVVVVAIVLAVSIYHKDRVIAIVLTTAQKRQALKDWSNSLVNDSQNSKVLFSTVVDRMTDNEVNTAYEAVFVYIKNQKTVPINSTLAIGLNAISTKYNIFN